MTETKMTPDNLQNDNSAQFENAKVIFTLGHELDTVKCRCGMEYFLFCVFRDDEGTPETRIWPQDRVYFCPYCGVQNEELARRLKQIPEDMEVEAAAVRDKDS